MSAPTFQKHNLQWRECAVEVLFWSDRYNLEAAGFEPMAHLEITRVDVEGEPLPITETGYRSHFLPPQHVEDEGGPVAYVLAWFDHDANSDRWKAYELSCRQMSLF